MIVKIFENGPIKKNHFYEVVNLKYTKVYTHVKDLEQGCILIGTYSNVEEAEDVIILNLVETGTKLPFTVVVAGRGSIYIMNNEAKTIEVIKLVPRNSVNDEGSHTN